MAGYLYILNSQTNTPLWQVYYRHIWKKPCSDHLSISLSLFYDIASHNNLTDNFDNKKILFYRIKLKITLLHKTIFFSMPCYFKIYSYEHTRSTRTRNPQNLAILWLNQRLNTITLCILNDDIFSSYLYSQMYFL